VTRGAVGVLLATAFAVAALLVPVTAIDVRAATPDLTLVSHAHYEVQPRLGRVRITLDITATNRLRDTVTRRFFFDRTYLAVQPDTRGFRISSSVGSPSVSVARRTRDQTLLLLSFGRRLASGRSATFRLQFDLADPGGAATRDVRIGDSLVSFPVWAFASNQTPGSRVSVSFPPGFTVRVEAGELSGPQTDGSGRTTLSSGSISAPLRFYAYLVADRPGSYTETTRTVTVGATIARLTIRAWADDAGWTQRVGDLFVGGLPEIAGLTGLEWPDGEALVVEEAVSRSTGGYAGLFDPAEGRVEVAYYASPFVVLHEAAHSWFNGELLADRWANEGFASYYAVAAGKQLGVRARGAPLTPALRRVAIPLNAWQPIGRVSGATNDYGYAASHALARQIAKRAGDAVLRDVWRAVAARELPHSPDDAPEAERGTAAPDWRGLLDLLEARTGERFDDLWQAWVVRPEEAPLLAARRTTLADYQRTLEQAGDWTLPRAVRDALRTWRFDEARELLAQARIVLDRQEELAVAARRAGLRPPGRVEELFESRLGFEAAASEADAELRTIDAVVAALRARPSTPDGFQRLGLFGVRPEASIAEASAAFERGDLVEAVRAAANARSTWQGASDVGRSRMLTMIAIALVAGVFLVWFVVRVRRLRRHRRRRRLARAPMAHRL
jgi:hypothetical protein